MDQVSYRAQKAWKALHLVMHVLKKKKIGIQKVYPTRHCYVLLLNVGLHAEIRVENDR